MTEEEKQENNEKKCKCCCSKELKMFLLVIFGSFLGCLVALCLFSAMMRPKFPPPMPMGGQPQIQQMHQGKFDRHKRHHSEFKGQKQKNKKDFKQDRQDISDDAPQMREPHPFDDDKD